MPTRNGRIGQIGIILTILAILVAAIGSFATVRAAAGENRRRIEAVEIREARLVDDIRKLDRNVERILTILEERKEKP